MASPPVFTSLLVRDDKQKAMYRSKLREEVTNGLLHAYPVKTLPGYCTYDEEGSMLFQQITAHPDYYLTRAETELLNQHGAEILRLANPTAVFELGAGDCVKSRVLLGKAKEGSRLEEYWPLDFEEAILKEVCPQVSIEFPSIAVKAIVADYQQQFVAIAEEVAMRRKGEQT